MSKKVLVDIRNNQFATLTIEEGTSVVWRNLDPYAHSAETLRNSAYYFNAGALLPGETSSPIFFSKAGQFDYLCRFHAGMTGTVTVMARGAAPAHSSASPSDQGHEHGHGGSPSHLLHFHGFVTGGSSAQRLYMTHTPVLADSRHHYQVILQGSLPDATHAAAYERLRASDYGHRRVQIFHNHLALADIGSGHTKLLPESRFEYYPPPKNSAGRPVEDPVRGLEEDVPGLEENIPVRIDRVLHFHQFQTDADYPDGLTYLVYGDIDDVFIDHFIDRAPSFHSVAKLKKRPDFFTKDCIGKVVKVSIPSKRIRDVEPKLIRRVSFVDNNFHLFWLPPPGVYPQPQDPLRPLVGDTAPPYDVIVEGGKASQIEIERFLHFDVRLLNYGVLIV